jgi:hypothetical protein
MQQVGGVYTGAAVTSVNIWNLATNFNGGTIYIYGAN